MTINFSLRSLRRCLPGEDWQEIDLSIPELID